MISTSCGWSPGARQAAVRASESAESEGSLRMASRNLAETTGVFLVCSISI